MNIAPRYPLYARSGVSREGPNLSFHLRVKEHGSTYAMPCPDGPRTSMCPITFVTAVQHFPVHAV